MSPLAWPPGAVRAACPTTRSIGWPSQPRLQAGTPYPYRLWDPETALAGRLGVPLAVMDATLSEETRGGLRGCGRGAGTPPEHGGAVAILWHPPQHHPRLSKGFDRVYRRLLAWIDERGGWAGSAAEVLDRWERRRGQSKSS